MADVAIRKTTYDDFSVPTDSRNFEIICETKKMYVSAGWLAELSPFFGELCFTTGHKQLIIDDIPYVDMLEFLRCITYCPMRKPLTASNVLTVLRIASRFNMDPVKMRAECFIAQHAKHLNQTGLIEASMTLSQCDPNSTTLSVLVDRLASMKEADLSTLEFHDMPGNVVADVFNQRMRKKKSCAIL